MSESENSNKSRTVEQVQQEYTQVCARAGHIQYQIAQLKNDLELANSSLQSLNREAFDLAQAKAKEAAAATSNGSSEKPTEAVSNA